MRRIKWVSLLMGNSKIDFKKIGKTGVIDTHNSLSNTKIVTKHRVLQLMIFRLNPQN